MESSEQTEVRVFISYSHDSEDHKSRVLSLAHRLIQDGIDIRLDRYEESPEEGWPRWMEDQVSKADFVLVVATEIYEKRFSGHDEPGTGLGASWEGCTITQEIYESGGRNAKFIPIIFEAEDSAFIPGKLRSATRYLVSGPSEYLRLYRRLTRQPELRRPERGKIIRLDEKVVEPFLGEPQILPSMSRRQLFIEVGDRLKETERVFKDFGPSSEAALRNPLTAGVEIWKARKLDTILPKNREIIQLIERHRNLLTPDEYRSFLRFKSHATAFQDSQFTRLDGDAVPIFPDEFRTMIEAHIGESPDV